MAKRKLAKKVDKLESRAEELQAQADELREAIADRAEDLSATTRETADSLAETAAEKLDELEESSEEGSATGGGVKRIIGLLLAAFAGLGVYLKRKRDRELDEALWEDPRAL